MKNSFFFNCRTLLKHTIAMRILAIASLLFFLTDHNRLQAQQTPRLSIQGILKKSSGEAVPDGSYGLTFRLYTTPIGGQSVWAETQPNVDVISGIYSTVLGNSNELDSIAFDTIYYLGVTVGSSEMTPRIQLTSAPYALALIGNSNRFPSSGMVKADSIQLKGGVLARAGVPGNNGTNHSGYAFLGNNGQKDSGLFSTPTSGNVSLYVDNLEKLKATADSVVIKPDLRFGKGSNINYNGVEDWRLVYDDNLSGGANGWKVYNALGGQNVGWNNTTEAGTSPLSGDATKFVGRYLYPALNEQVLKKFYDLSNVGTYNYIKVKFKYYFIDSWNGPNYDEGNHDAGFAAFAESAAGDQFRLGWVQTNNTYQNYISRLTTTAFNTANKWEGNATNTEQCGNYEMTAFKNGNSTGFWLMFGSSLNGTHTDESYGVGMIEIWVK